MMYLALSILFGILYIADSAAQLKALVSERETLRRVTKVLLMPLLALTFVFARLAASLSVPWLVIAALLLGCAGDILLLGFKNKICSPLGAVSFAAGHIVYIMQIWRVTPAPNWAVVSAVLIIYGIVACIIYKKLWPYMKGIVRIGVVLYMLPICFMSASAAVGAFTALNAGAFVLLVGTLVFMLSDSTLSFQTFRGKTRRGHVMVMATYIIAQALIAAGFFIWI